MSEENLNILFLEDEEGYRLPMKRRFEKKGHKVTAIATLPECEKAWKINGEDYDVIIMDRQIVQDDGKHDALTLLKNRRAKGDETPVLILSARYQSHTDRLEGLQLQAEYVDKECPFAELMLRVRNQYLNKTSSRDKDMIVKGRLRIDKPRKLVCIDGQSLEGSAKTFSLFLAFVENEEQLLTKTWLLENVWNFPFDTGTNTIDVMISRIRARIRSIDPDLDLIETVRGKGYIFHAGGLYK